MDKIELIEETVQNVVEKYVTLYNMSRSEEEIFCNEVSEIVTNLVNGYDEIDDWSDFELQLESDIQTGTHFFKAF